MAPKTSRAQRVAMYGRNKLKPGFFGPNCSSGRFVTKAPERWSGSWDDNIRLAQMADEAGIDFLLPIAPWKGYGGDTALPGGDVGDHHLGHRPTGPHQAHHHLWYGARRALPAADCRQADPTADHVGQGRFGLNLVRGWNEGEFEMLGVQPGDHDRRYRLGQEWLDVLKLIWEKDEFDFKGEAFDLKGMREKPKPYGSTFTPTMNAGASGEGRTFALRNCDAWFTDVQLPNFLPASFAEAASVVQSAKGDARAMGNEIGAYTVGVIVCRPTRARKRRSTSTTWPTSGPIGTRRPHSGDAWTHEHHARGIARGASPPGQ